MSIRFTKMHGLGNDFIVVNVMDNDIGNPREFALQYCDRRFGIGADQLLLVDSSDEADFTMRILNADGSEVEMCGNGIRCIAKFIADNRLSRKTTLAIETMAGIMYPTIKGDKVRVNMGRPILEPARIPMVCDQERAVRVPITVNDDTFTVTAVSMGNPHCVIFVDNVEFCDLETIGPRIERSPLFPKRTNVEFVHVISPSHLKVRVWERGSGLTLACGTGACASVVAACLHTQTERTATVTLPGGDLLIEWADTDEVFMTGPAHTVFEGSIE